jgi:hypothetical protein
MVAPSDACYSMYDGRVGPENCQNGLEVQTHLILALKSPSPNPTQPTLALVQDSRALPEILKAKPSPQARV